MIRGTLQWEYSPDNVTHYRLYAIPEVVWTQRDGTEILVSEMATSHIVHAGRLVYRKYQSIAIEATQFYSYAAPTADAASMEWEGWHNGIQQEITECEYWLETFADELIRRGIRPTWQIEGTP
jgi:hypothetical protein